MHGLTAFETGCRLTGGQQPWRRSTVIQPVCPVLAPPVAGLRRHSSDSCNSVETQLVSDAMRSAPWPELKVKTGEREPSLPHSGVLLGMARSNSKPITHRSVRRLRLCRRLYHHAAWICHKQARLHDIPACLMPPLHHPRVPSSGIQYIPATQSRQQKQQSGLHHRESRQGGPQSCPAPAHNVLTLQDCLHLAFT